MRRFFTACLLLPLAACQATFEEALDRSTSTPDLIHALETRLYRPARAGLTDLRARFELHLHAEGEEADGGPVEVTGELLWKAPGRSRVIPAPGSLHLVEAVGAIEQGYLPFLDASIAFDALEQIGEADCRFVAPDRLELTPTTVRADQALGFRRIERAVVLVNEHDLPVRIMLEGELEDEAALRDWPRQAHIDLHYLRLGDQFLIERLVETSPFAETELELRFTQQAGITVPSGLTMVLHRPDHRDDLWRCVVQLELHDLRLNAGIEDRELEQPAAR